MLEISTKFNTSCPTPSRNAATVFRKLQIRLFAALCLLFISAVLSVNLQAATSQVDDDGVQCPGAFTNIQAAVTAALPNDIIQVCSGNYLVSSTIVLNKAGLTLIGIGASRPIVQIPASTGNGFHATAANVTLDNFEIQKTDLLGTPHELILVQANNFTAQNNLIYGPNPGGTWSSTGLVSRGFVVTGGLSGLLLTNNTIHTLRQPAYINGPTTGTISNNNVSGTRGWVIDGATITFTNNTFGPPANQGADIALLASCNPADYPNLSALSANNDNAVISAQFGGGVSGSATTYVNGGAAPGGVGTIDAPFQTIAQGINGVYVGGTVNVAPGIYNEDVNVNKSGVIVSGAGTATTIVSGPIGGGGSTFTITASNVELRNFQITRAGNNTTDWNNPGLNSAGISIQGLSISGALIHDNIITGMRTAIDINSSNGHTIRNNVIDSNRTGLIFRNQTDNLTVVENFITNNFTVGVLFLDASGGTNIPAQTALNSSFSNNNLSGNWYGQIVDRQSGGSLPAPNTTNLKNFRFNWLGTTSPVVTTANSSEPVYAAQIPVAFGGTATAPGGQPDIAGPASANIKYIPLLTSGTDSNVETTPGRGTFGFQGALSLVTVKPSLLNGWFYYNDETDVIDNSLGTFVGGPVSPPSGVGSAQISVTGTQRRNLATYQFSGTPLADIATLKYSTYNPSAGNGGSPNRSGYLQFNVDFNGSDTFQRRLVFLPSDNGTITQNTWKEWDAVNGGNALWRYSGSTWAAGIGGGGEPGTTTKTWSQILSQYPGVRVRVTDAFMGIRVGEPYSNGYTENIDLFKFGTNAGTTHFDFEPERPTVTINQASGQVDPTSTSPINFTVTFSEPVSGFSASGVVLGGTAGATTKVITGGPTVYNVAVGGFAGSGTVTASVADSAAASNSSSAPNTVSTSTDNTVTFFTCNNVSLPNTTNVPTNTQFTIPVTTDSLNGRGIISFDFKVAYNPAVVTPIGVDKTGTLTSGFTITTNNSGGVLTVSGFGFAPLTGSGTLINLKFISFGGISTTSGLNFNNFQYNNGVPCVNVDSGNNVNIISGEISGTVLYGNGTGTLPVVRTTLSAAGSVNVSSQTNLSGNYSLSGLGSGAYTVTASKTAGQDVNGIDAFDAAQIAQHVVGLITLNAVQLAAANVSGSPQVSSYDAALIAQYVVSIPNPGVTGAWRFTPVSLSYPSGVTTNQTNKDYTAILMGDVNGDWDDPVSRSVSKSEAERTAAATVNVTAPTQFTNVGSNFDASITVGNTSAENIISYQFDLVYNSSVIQPQAGNPCDVSGTISSNLAAFCNPATPGLLKVAVFGSAPLNGAGILLKLKFTAVGLAGSSSPLTLQTFKFNNGTPPNTLTSGLLTISSPTAASVSLAGRLLTTTGRGVANARVSLTDTTGEVRMAISNSAGHYRFENVEAGQTYIISVDSKRYKFQAQSVSIVEDLTTFDLIAEQ